MGVFDKLGQAFGVSSSKGIDIEEYMNSAEMADVDALHEPADMYVKPVNIESEDDVKLIEEELSKRNIILGYIGDLEKRPTTKTNIISALKAYVTSIDGDIAQIDEARIILTPKKVKIIKRKKAEQ